MTLGFVRMLVIAESDAEAEKLAEGAYLRWYQSLEHQAHSYGFTALFLSGLAVDVIATQSGIGRYDDVLFWDHMVQHLLLLMVAPPLLVVGQPATLLLHASRNPLHTWTKKVLRSRVMAAITWPPFGVALYVATIVGTHLTGFMNLVETNGAVHDGEHALYLIAGYLYFLPLIGREPIRWRVSYPSRIFLLFIAMPVDAFTGLVLGSESRNPFPGLAEQRPSWAPNPLSDVHIGGAVMWVGGAGIMFGLVMAVFFAWSRERRADGWRPAENAEADQAISGAGSWIAERVARDAS